MITSPDTLLSVQGLVGGFDTPYPASRVEEEYLPDLDRVLDAVDRTFGF